MNILFFTIWKNTIDQKWYRNLRWGKPKYYANAEIVTASNHRHETYDDCERDITFVKEISLDTVVHELVIGSNS